MQWINDIVTGLIEVYGTNNPYEICDYMNIKVKKVEPNNCILANNNSVYIRNYFNSEVIFIRNDLSHKYEEFYIRHELGHAILHTNIINTGLINIDKLEKQANYFAFKLSQINFDIVELEQLTIDQISCCLEIPLSALKQIYQF
ncbi:ImmA/IrrE family metallo-endopeptidase [Caminicella sporogenes]|uniref:ImmA/IrrE family metallo-endopeptidase n=1 Tax=Caminicella sporogenes TaxID=166485 RepID=UPI002540AE7F|nr:ImmA/IrrE family metallo-endopeptidase [Caminicella sporogenes]WIF95166.1 ImmA/IrrE family metallo-endopeptidase [Caminicella sporogenes]